MIPPSRNRLPALHPFYARRSQRPAWDRNGPYDMERRAGLDKPENLWGIGTRSQDWPKTSEQQVLNTA